MSNFQSGMLGVLGGMQHVQQQQEHGEEKRRVSGLRALAGEVYGAQDPTLGKIAALGGDAAGMQKDMQGQEDRKRKRVGEMATTLLALPAHMRPAAYRQMAPEFPTLGIQGAPADYSDELEPLLQSVSAQFGGGSADAFKPMNVSPGGQVVDPRTGKVIHSNQNFAPMKPIWDSARGGWVMPLDQQGPPTAPSAPTMTNAGGPESFGPMTFGQAMDKVQKIEASSGQMIPVAQRKLMIQQLMTSGQMNTDVGGGPTPARSPGFVPVVAPKADAPRQPPGGYEWGPDGRSLAPIPGGPAQVAIDARQAASDAKQTASQVRQSEAAGQAAGLVAAIDRLTGSSGFADLGTTWGDVERNVPLIRNDTKDADAQLKNIAGQVALTTMSRLKALSATGATGFGSLTAPELRLLENSLASLQAENISNAELKASLKIIRDSMQKVADWKDAAPAQSAPAAPAAGGWSIKAVP